MLAHAVDDDRTEEIHLGDAIVVEVAAPANDALYPCARRPADELASASTLYEEFHPYGTTSYRAMRGELDASAGRYRYTGMEKDEETGLAQHGARYYAGWLGRWVSADPIGVGGGVNLYEYARSAPTNFVDRTGNSPCAADDLGCSSEDDEYTSDLDTPLTDEDEASLGGGAPYTGTPEGAGGGTSLFDVVTSPHRFMAGQIVGAAEGSWDLATALPKLGWALYEDHGAVGAGMRQRWNDGGVLAFTPLPGLWSNLGGIFSASDPFAAGRSWGHAAVNMAETVGLVVGTAGTVRSFGVAVGEYAAKLLATRGILVADLADISGLGAAAAAATGAIGEGAAAGARLLTPTWRVPSAGAGSGATGHGRLAAGRPLRSTAASRTNAQLIQDIATRAGAKIGGSGSVAGTLKHSYAAKVLDRYQRFFGNRGLETEVSFLGRQRVPYGTTGSVRLDVLDTGANITYDYKFVLRPPGLSRGQVLRIRMNGPLGIQVLEINP